MQLQLNVKSRTVEELVDILDLKRMDLDSLKLEIDALELEIEDRDLLEERGEEE